MPEGDIVARVARRLDAELAGRTLARGELRWPTLGGVDLAGATVLANVPVGKHLLTRLADGRTLRTHLRMDGSWRIHPLPTPRRPDRHPDVRCVLATEGALCLGLLLGMMDLVPTAREHTLVGHLGPDLLGPALDAVAAGRRLADEGARPVGEALLDQRVVAGVGTIYLAETLWRLRIHPLTPAGTLGPRAGDIVATASALLARSVAAPWPTATGLAPRGDREGATGEANLERMSTYCYGRTGKPCPRCGAAITRLAIGPPAQERSAYYCPECQPGP